MSTPLLQQFPSLSTYATSFLKDLLSSPELTEAFIFSLPEVQNLAVEVEKLGRENEELARRNLDIRDELFALRDATAQSYAHAEGLKQRWQELERAQVGLYQRHRPSFLHLRLRHSITSQDDLSESIAAAFIEGLRGNGGSTTASGSASRVDSPAFGQSGNETSLTQSALVGDRSQNKAIDDFISEFKASRKTYHKRAIWAERWARGEVAWRDD